jgi:hypothetical protein
MRIKTVCAKSKKEARKYCPWASVITEVDSGKKGARAWMCFESWEDYRIAMNQK